MLSGTFLPFYYTIVAIAISVAIAADGKVALRKLCSPQDIVQANYKQPPSLNVYLNKSDFYGTSSIFKVHPQHIANNGIVTVHFSSSNPQSTDWIGAFIKRTSDTELAFAPVKYACCALDSAYVSSGVGSLRFSFVALRDDITFHFFKNGTSYPLHVASAPWSVAVGSSSDPLKPRVIADDDGFRVLWSSGSALEPVLRYRLAATGPYTHTISASTTDLGSVIPRLLCGAPASSSGYHSLGYQHSAALPPASHPYYYSFGDLSLGIFSREYTFYPPTGSGRVILVDDVGRGSSSDDAYLWAERETAAANTSAAIADAVRRSSAKPISGIIIGGDISYASGHLASWEFFLDLFSEVFSSILVMTLVGNHESSSLFSRTDSGGECGAVNGALLPMPPPATANKPWWSKNVGLMHIVGMSTEHNFSTGSEQYEWLVADLAAVDRQLTPHVIFGGHRAMYAYAPQTKNTELDDKVSTELRYYIEPLFAKYRVTFAHWGHKHSYQRLAAIRLGEVQHSTPDMSNLDSRSVMHTNPRGTVHVVVGSGGAAFAKSTSSAAVCPEKWCEFLLYEHGFGILTAENATHLTWEWIANDDRKVKDRVVIVSTSLPVASRYRHFSDFVITIILICAVSILGFSVYQRVCLCLAQRYYRNHYCPHHPYQEV